MKPFNILFLFCLTHVSLGQITLSENDIRLGDIERAYEIKADIILTNIGVKKAFLLKADAELGLKVYVTKKTLLPNDTALMVISFIPETNGNFSKEIKLFTSDKTSYTTIHVKGKVNQLITDDKTACFYFGKPSKTKVQTTEVIVKNEPMITRDNSNKMPDNSKEDNSSISTSPLSKKDTTQHPVNQTELPETLYKPNNILFLVDVSNSMKDSLKLPLMKKALHYLINELRDIDKITFVTYADSIKVLKENITGDKKVELHELIANIKARGLTKGRQAILKSTDIVINNYIADGNNQIFLITDGKFNFYSEDEKQFLEKQKNHPVKISTIGFGSDKAAIKNLKEIAEKGSGNFIHIKKKSNSEELLLNEIKKQSIRP